MVLVSMDVRNCCGQKVAGVKTLLFLVIKKDILIIKKDILVLGEGSIQGLDDTTITAETKYPINFTRSRRKFVLSLHYNRSNSFLFLEVVKMDEFEAAKDSKIKPYPLCLGNISKDFTMNNNMKKTGLKEHVRAFSVGYNIINTNDILGIHNYWIIKCLHSSKF